MDDLDAAIDQAKQGNLEFFKELPVDILLNARDSDGRTVLWIVVYANHVDCCKEICKRCPSLLCSQHYQGVETPLHVAAYFGYVDILKILVCACDEADLENQHDIEDQDGDRADRQKTLKLSSTMRDGSNAMHMAVYGGKLESIKLLIEADPNNKLLRARDGCDNTPLHLAVQTYQVKIARLLIEADPDYCYGANSDRNMTPLLLAIKSAHFYGEMLKLIMELQPNQSMVSYNKNGWSALHYCVSEQNLYAFEYIIQSCPESSTVIDNEGQNFFHHAVNLGYVEMVKHILGMKEITSAVLNIPDKLGRTPWDVAVESRNNTNMILCIYEDRRVTKSENYNWVVKTHNFVMMKMFLKTSPDFLMTIEVDVFQNSVDENGDTILYKAAQENHLFLCKELYRACHSLIYHQGYRGRTALHQAASRGETEMLKFLIEAGTKSYNKHADDDIKMLLTMLDNEGFTALHMAVYAHKLEAVKLLVEADPDYDYGADKYGDTPITLSIKLARSNENKLDTGEIRRLLFKMQPRQTMAHSGENDWTSLLHQATSEEDLSIIEDIIKFCTGYLDVEDDNGRNFFHIAAKLGKVEVVKLVLRAKDIPSNVLYNKDEDGNTPMHIAAVTGNMSLMECFLSDHRFRKIMPHGEENGWKLPHHAASDGDLGIIKDIIKWRSNLDVVDNEGKNFLHIAAEFEKVEVVKLILRAKGIPEDILNHEDNDGNTPFHIAAVTGNEPLTRCFLFDKNVKKTIVNKKGEKALHAIKFPYDKRKAGVLGLVDTVDQSDLKDQSEFDLVVGALIATVSFTAGITVPGGYMSDGPNQGTAVFSKKVSFAAFIISNSFALILSFFAVICHFCAKRLTEDAHIILLLNVAKGCTLAAMYCMMVAFIAGSFAVLANSTWLAMVVCIVSCLFFILSCGPLGMIGMQCMRVASARQQNIQFNTNIVTEQTNASSVGLLPIYNTPMSERL